MIQQTSLEAYITIRDTGSARTRRAVIYQLISNRPGICDTEIMKILGLPRNVISPRRRELVQEGFIKEEGRVNDPASGRQVMAWRAL